METSPRRPSTQHSVQTLPVYWMRLIRIASIVAVAWVLSLWVWRLRATWNVLSFDDAFMFLRYAKNFRHGLGISWNLDGVPTYGMTAPLWGAVVYLGSYLPLQATQQLLLSSWLFSLGAIVAMAWAVALNARGPWLSSTWRVLPLVALPLAYQFRFYKQAFTGMETMLAALLGALYVGSALAWARGNVKPAWLGLLGFLYFLARPESMIAVVLMPLMLLWLIPSVKLRDTVVLLSVFFAILGIYLLACRAYFHTALPLSFYEKSLRGYEGYIGRWHPRTSLLLYLSGAPFYLCAVILFVRGANWRMLCCCIAPALATCLYLTTTLQIMGHSSRYYEAYLGFFVVPSLLLVDSWLTSVPASRLGNSPFVSGRVVMAMTLLALSLLLRWHKVTPWMRRIETPVYAYDPVILHRGTEVPLPVERNSWSWGYEILKNLPNKSTIAYTEVGNLGLIASNLNVIDLAGLNDTDIALHGLQMGQLLARKPDVIFFPVADYTYDCGLMLDDAQLYEQYDVYYERGGPQLALRRESPSYALMKKELQIYWEATYPKYALEDYRIRSASWSKKKYKVDP